MLKRRAQCRPSPHPPDRPPEACPSPRTRWLDPGGRGGRLRCRDPRHGGRHACRPRAGCGAARPATCACRADQWQCADRSWPDCVRPRAARALVGCGRRRPCGEQPAHAHPGPDTAGERHKIWTAVLVLQFAARLGDLEDTVALAAGLLPFGDRITLRQPLTHTSGLLDNNDAVSDPAACWLGSRSPSSTPSS